MLLLLVRADNDSNRPGDYDLPGGSVEESDRSLVHAAAREIAEETGLVISPESIRELAIPAASVRKPLVERHVFFAPAQSNVVRINPLEHTGFLWVTPDEAVKLFVHPFYTPVIAAYANNK